MVRRHLNQPLRPQDQVFIPSDGWARGDANAPVPAAICGPQEPGRTWPGLSASGDGGGAHSGGCCRGLRTRPARAPKTVKERLVHFGFFFCQVQSPRISNELLVLLRRFRRRARPRFRRHADGARAWAKLAPACLDCCRFCAQKSGHMPELVARRLRPRPLPEGRLRFTPSCQPFFGTCGF